MESNESSSVKPAPRSVRVLHTAMALLGGVLLVLWGLVLPHGDSGDAFREAVFGSTWFVRSAAILWLVIIIESAVGLFVARDPWRARLRRFGLLVLLPPFRMAVATATPADRLWFPFKGWQRTGAEPSLEIERRLALPMLLVTLLVIPVVVAEFGFGAVLDARPRLAAAIHLATCLIWTAFSFEFIWMIAATPEKWRYVSRHWLHLIIILLPMLAFLRMLRMLSFLRTLKAGQLLRTMRLRGLGARFWRTILLFDLLDRWRQRNPERMREHLQGRIAVNEAELARLREKLDELDAGAGRGN